MKRCYRCRCEYPLDGFYRHARNKGGLDGLCKGCRRAHNARWHESRRTMSARAREGFRALQAELIARGRKLCGQCHRDLPLAAFHVSRRPVPPHDHGGICKGCQRGSNQAYYAQNRNRILEYKSGPGRPYAAAFVRRWQRLYPEKHRAHRLVADAIADGTLTRPDTCARCGNGGLIHGHHADYSRPLDVEWLCVQCHRLEHAGAIVA